MRFLFQNKDLHLWFKSMIVEARRKEAHLQKIVKSLPMLDYLREKERIELK